MYAVMRLAVLVAVSVVLAGCGNLSETKAADTSSPSYKKGLESGTKGIAEVDAFKGTSDNQACKASFDLESGAFPSLNKQDYMAGCLYGISHQSAQWNQLRRK
jgi:hypothetical protein